MLYCVSYTNGIVGVFSSIENIKLLVFNKYPSITFIIQAYKNEEEEKNNKTVWVVIYKNIDACAYVSTNKEKAIEISNIINKIGKGYDDDIDYWEQDIDTITDNTKIILKSLQEVYGSTGIIAECESNIIYY